MRVFETWLLDVPRERRGRYDSAGTRSGVPTLSVSTSLKCGHTVGANYVGIGHTGNARRHVSGRCTCMLVPLAAGHRLQSS